LIPEDDATLARRGAVFLVCDGMGGHAAGQIASELAAKTFLDVYYEHPGADPAEALRAAVAAANRFVVSVGAAVPARRGMGTTLTGLVILQDAAYLVHAGDSRLYRLRDGHLQQMSNDHTVMEEMVRTGVLTREQAANHPQKHAILRCIGLPDGVEPDVERYDLLVGDRFFLCSDGVTNHVDDAAILRLMSTHGPGESEIVIRVLLLPSWETSCRDRGNLA
ncbi:serine/threonine-protein phosphatase, partial [bacterium]